jgi:hypothetical protein
VVASCASGLAADARPRTRQGPISLLEALHTIADSSGHENNVPILVEVTPGRFVKVKLSDKWRKFGAASSENIERARNIVDLAEAAFEADRATKQ